MRPPGGVQSAGRPCRPPWNYPSRPTLFNSRLSVQFLLKGRIYFDQAARVGPPRAATFQRPRPWNERSQFPTPTRWGIVLQNEKPGFWPGDRKHSERDETPTSWISIGTSVGSLCNRES
jgi:hypothetical protein